MTQYYLSTAGNDANDGLSEASPWKTIDKANTLTLKPGDKVLFHCGQVFPGELTIHQSGTESNPIIISSYGTGSKPIITGAIPVTGWQSGKDNRFSTYMSHSVFQLFVDDGLYHLSRIPSSGLPSKRAINPA
jgi:hypothetical protein